MIRRPIRTLPVLWLVGLLPTLLGGCGAPPSAAPSGTGPTPYPAPRPSLAITDANVVDVVSGAVLPGRTVLVRDGRIVRIGASGEVPSSEAEEVLDGTGRYLIPGLWDAHVHFRDGMELVEQNRALLPLYVANGVTTVRDAGGDIVSAVMAWRDSIAAGQMIGPRIFTAGPKLDGPRPGWPGSIPLTSPAQVPAAIDSLQSLGVDFVKIYDGSTPADVYLAIIEETERRGMLVTGHMPFSVRFLDAVERGLDGTEHLYFAYKSARAGREEVTREFAAGALSFWEALYRIMHAPSPANERETLDALVRAGTVVVPTLHIGAVIAGVDQDDHQDDPELRYIAPGIEETYQGRVRSARRGSPQGRRLLRELRDSLKAFVPRLHEAGVVLLAGSDAGPSNSYVYPGFSLHSEMEALVDAGLTPLDALRAATLRPAEFMRRGEDLGRIEEGYVADLVLLRSNPLSDIRNARDIEAVVLAGRRVLGAEALGRLLAEVARPE